MPSDSAEAATSFEDAWQAMAVVPKSKAASKTKEKIVHEEALFKLKQTPRTWDEQAKLVNATLETAETNTYVSAKMKADFKSMLGKSANIDAEMQTMEKQAIN